MMQGFFPHIHHEDDCDDSSEGLSVSQVSGSEGTSSNTFRAEKEFQSSIARKEERTVNLVRILVLIAIICSAVAVGLAVYFFATANDEASFELEVRKRVTCSIG